MAGNIINDGGWIILNVEDKCIIQLSQEKGMQITTYLDNFSPTTHRLQKVAMNNFNLTLKNHTENSPRYMGIAKCQNLRWKKGDFI